MSRDIAIECAPQPVRSRFDIGRVGNENIRYGTHRDLLGRNFVAGPAVADPPGAGVGRLPYTGAARQFEFGNHLAAAQRFLEAEEKRSRASRRRGSGFDTGGAASLIASRFRWGASLDRGMASSSGY